MEYEWFFVDDEQERTIRINEVFDILPLRGVIEKGGTEKVEFSYYAVPSEKYNLTAVCRLTGGPEYYVNIKAEASDVEYKLEIPN